MGAQMIFLDAVLLLACAYMMIKSWAQYQTMANTERIQKLQKKLQDDQVKMMNIDAESNESMEDFMARMAKQVQEISEDITTKQNTKDMMIFNAHRTRAIAFSVLFTTFALSTAMQWIQINGLIQLGISLIGFMITAMLMMRTRSLLQMSQKL